MKILMCDSCGDLFNLTTSVKSCSCGKTKGKYCFDQLNAVVTGGISIGFSNETFLPAIRNRPKSGMGKNFIAFIIPEICNTVKVVEEIDKEESDE